MNKILDQGRVAFTEVEQLSLALRTVVAAGPAKAAGIKTAAR
jgi:hypothetical protein